MFHYRPLFINVNEEGDRYDFHDDIESALGVLRQFPNDHIIVIMVKADGPEDGNDPVTGIAHNH